jgi:hypothetical protein
MSEQKSHSFRPPLYHGTRSTDSIGKSANDDQRSPNAEQQGWDAYRKWLSRVSTLPVRERSPVDHSLYSWKGYNSWADKIKRSWNPEETES